MKNIKFLLMTLFITLSRHTYGGVYDDTILPMINQCPTFLTGTSQIKATVVGNYAAWEGGRFNHFITCYDEIPLAKDKDSKKNNKGSVSIIANFNIKSGNSNSVPTTPNSDTCDNCGKPGSIILMDSRTLGENVDIIGVPFKLVYYSSRASGNKLKGTLKIPVNDPNPNVTSIRVYGSYAGSRNFDQTFSNIPGQVYDFTWDNKDAAGNLMNESTVNFNVVYGAHGKFIPITYAKKIGGMRSAFLKFGGWQPSNYHYFDFVTNTLEEANENFSKKIPKLKAGTYDYYVTADDGDIYVFNANGKHLKTLFGITGATKFQFNHDDDGLLTLIGDAYGQTTTFTRNPTTKLVTSITSPKWQVTNLSYNANGDLTSITNPANEAHTMTYSGTSGLLATFTKPGGEVSSFTYDSLGGLLKDAHSGGFSSTLTQANVLDRYPIKRVTLTSELGRQETRNLRNVFESTGESHSDHFATNGEQVYSRASASLVSRQILNVAFENNSFNTDYRTGGRYLGRITIGMGQSAMTETFTRGANLADNNDPFSIISLGYRKKAGLDVWSSDYQGASKEWTYTTPENRISKNQLDYSERVKSSQRGNLAKVQHDYLPDGRISKSVWGNRVTRYLYDAKGYLNKVINPNGEITTFINDITGRRLSSTANDGRKTNFVYDSNSRIHKIIPPNGQEHILNYNEMELLGSYQSPVFGAENNETKYEYSLDKELKKIILPDYREINYIYDNTTTKLNQINTTEGNIYYDYDSYRSSPVKIKDNFSGVTNEIRYSYLGTMIAGEDYGREGGVTYSRLKYDYDEKFRLKTIYLKDQANASMTPISYRYDRDNLMIQAGEMVIKRDATLGHISNLILKNSEVKFSVDPTYGELSKIEHKFKGQIKSFTEFKRDKLGRIVEEATPTDVYSFFYDKAGRFTGRSLKNSGKPVSSFVYDRNGNRVSGNDNGKEFKAHFDPQDRLIKFNDTTYAYNANGFLSQKFSPGVGATTYTYDSLGNLKRVQLPNNDLNYEVDALGRRVVVKQYANSFKTRYVWDGELRIIAELGAGGNRVKKYVYAEGLNSPEYMEHLGRKYHFIKDHRGSVSLVVDSESGEVKQKLRYSEWGEVIEDTNPGFQPFGFAGGLYDNISKLYRFGARDYDPEIGRWLAKDPIGFDGGDTNLYGYVFNDPVNLIDLNGLFSAPVRYIHTGTIPKFWNGTKRQDVIRRNIGKIVDDEVSIRLKKLQKIWSSNNNCEKLESEIDALEADQEREAKRLLDNINHNLKDGNQNMGPEL